MASRRLLLLSIAASAAMAYIPRMPAETAAIARDLLGISPLPTAAPLMPRHLHERASGDVTFFFATDNTCGFVSGVRSAAITCNNRNTQTFSCALAQTAGAGGVVGCCDTATCLGLQTTCYGLAEITSGVCGPQCQADTAVILW
jgi:hypothetical protein